MNIRAIYILSLGLVLLTSCKDNEPREEQNNFNTEENEFSNIDNEIPEEKAEERDDVDEKITSNENSDISGVNKSAPGNTSNQNTRTSLSGQYIKKGEETDSNCGCYCLNLSSNTAELCLVNGKMYVNTRLQKNSNNTIDIFLVEPSARNTEGMEMPWEDFDRSSAIATIKPTSNGNMELDWLGFKINGDLAVDYAIFGKKTLEGVYKKK